MAQAHGKRPHRRGGASGAGRGNPHGTARSAGAARRPAKSSPAPKERDRQPTTPSPPFRLGAIEGATPGKWIDRWNERMPRTPLRLVPVSFAEQREVLLSGAVDAAIVRRPLAEDGLHVIPLYEEDPVVVMSAESDLTVADELDPDDLAGEVLLIPRDNVLGPLELPGTLPPRFDPLETTEDVIATVATGIGIAVMPMSLARLHHRRDVTYRRLRGGPTSEVVLAWPRDGDTDEVQTFVGIVRGRTARSSR